MLSVKKDQSVVTNKAKRCPECKAIMREVHRCRESDGVFVWFECAKKNCSGQWLERRPAV